MDGSSGKDTAEGDVRTIAETVDSGEGWHVADSSGIGQQGDCAAVDDADFAATAGDGEETPGVRATLLKQALDISSGKYCREARTILKNFPSVKGHRAERIKVSATAMANQLHSSIHSEWVAVLKVYDVVQHLNRLDEIASDPALRTGDNSAAWRPSGNVDKDIDSCDASSQETFDSLSTELARINAENEQLLKQCRDREASLAAKNEKLEQLSSIVDALDTDASTLPVDGASRFLQQSRKQRGLPEASAQRQPPQKRVKRGER